MSDNINRRQFLSGSVATACLATAGILVTYPLMADETASSSVLASSEIYDTLEISNTMEVYTE